MDNEKKNRLEAEADGVIEGRNAVIEALRAGVTIDKIYIMKGDYDDALQKIQAGLDTDEAEYKEELLYN